MNTMGVIGIELNDSINIASDYAALVSGRSTDANLTNLPEENGAEFEPGSAAVQLPAPNVNRSLSLMLSMLMATLNDEAVKSSIEAVEKRADDNKARHEEAMEALQKSQQEMARSKRLGVFQKVFGWVAAAFVVAAGALMIATGAGAVAGGIMIALAVDQMVGMATGKSAMGELTNAIATGLKNAGMEEPANSIVATVIVAVIVIAVTMGAGAASSTGRAASQLADDVPQAVAQAQARSLNVNLMHARNGTTGVGAASEAASAGSGIGSAVYKKNADDAKVDELRIRKIMTQNQAAIEETIEYIKKCQEASENNILQMITTINQEHQTNQTLIKSIA